MGNNKNIWIYLNICANMFIREELSTDDLQGQGCRHNIVYWTLGEGIKHSVIPA